MSFFDTSFEGKLIEAVKMDFFDLLNKVENENIYAISLVVDSDVSGFFLVFNTLEFLERKDFVLSQNDNLKEFREFMSPEEIKKMFGDYDGGFKSTKWIPTEWGYGNNSLEYSKINVINKELSKVSESLNNGFIFEKKVHGMMISSLLALKETLGFDFNEVVFFVSMSDDERVREIENSSANILNSESIYDEFINRFS